MKTLDSFCTTNSFLKTKFALTTFYNKRYSKWTERIILLIEYLQLISQGLLLHANASIPREFRNDPGIFRFIIYLFKLVNPSSLMPIQVFDSLSAVILLIVLGSMITKYFLFGYVLASAYWNRKSPRLLLDLWGWIFKLQGRILCYFITSFWVNVILACSAHTFIIRGLNQSAIIGISALLIVLEYIFSFSLETQFSYVLPTQNYLASKDYKIQILTLVQKFLLQIVQMAYSTNIRTSAWLFSVFNLILSAYKSFQFYEILPIYNLEALLFQGDLLIAVFSLNFTCFVNTILVAADYHEATTNLIIIMWIIISLLLGKLGRELIEIRIIQLLTLPAGKLPELIVHKVSAVKQMRRISKLPTKGTKKVDGFYFLSLLLNKNIQEVFNVSLKSMACEIPQFNLLEDNVDDIFQEYLTTMSAKFSGDSLVNLYLAYLCSKDPSLYMKAIKLIAGFKQTIWSQKHLSATILLYEIEKVKLSTQNQQDTSIDLLAYIKAQILVEDLSKNMLQEADLKIKICNNILRETPNIGQIYNFAQQVYKSKIQTQKKIKQLSSTLPDSFIEPLLLCGRYHLILDYSAEDYQKYSSLYLQKQTKYDKPFKEPTFTKDNLYQDGNVFLILSGEKGTNGQIAFATHSIESLCGSNSASYKGNHVSSLFTPSFQPIYNNILKQTFETGETKVLENLERAFICNKKGYIIETELYLKVHPFISYGFYLDMIIRPVPSTTKEYLLVKEDGTIEGATQKIAEALCLTFISDSPTSAVYNVNQISEDLLKINQAFNIIAKAHNKNHSDKKFEQSRIQKRRESFLATEEYKQALNIYNAYTSETKTVQLIPIIQQKTKKLENKTDNNVYDFGCNVSVVTYDDIIMKIFTLETADDEDQADRVNESRFDTTDNDEAKSKAAAKNKIAKINQDSEGSENIISEENIEFPTENRVNTYAGFLSPTYRGQNSSPRQNGTGEYKTIVIDTEFETENRLNTYVPLSPTSCTGVNIKKQMKNLLTPRPLSPPINSMPELSRTELIDVRSSINDSLKGRGDSLSSTYLQQIIPDKVLRKSFKSALAQDFHPKSFNFLCAVFYGVILATLFSQIIVKIISDDTMEALSIKKDLLTYSQLTTFKVLLIEINARGALNGIIDPTVNRSETDGGLPTALINLKSHLPDLRMYNQKVISGLQNLDAGIKRQVYKKDVRMNGTYYDVNSKALRNVTTFGAIDDLVDSLQKLLGLSRVDSEISLPYFTYIVKNALNDYLYKSQELKQIFTDSVNGEKAFLRSTITLCLAVTPVLLVGIVFTLAMIILHQYQTEKSQMLAFVKLRPETIQDIMRRLTDFKKKLDDREYVDRDGTYNIFTSGNTHYRESSYHKRYESQKINCSVTRARYLSYVLKVSCYIIFLLVIMLWNYISAFLSTNVIYRRQNQLEFANHISELISVSMCSFAEAFSSNDTFYIRRMPPTVFMDQALIEITELQHQIPELFLEEDRTYDPKIQDILFLNTECSQYNFTAPLYQYFCNFLVSKGQRINLVAVLSLFRTGFEGKILDAQICDRSNITSLLKCGYRNQEFILPCFIIATEAQQIAEVVANSIEDNISDANYQRNVFLTIFPVSLVIVGFLIWIQILSKLRNVHNDFKRVIQLFPPSLILSSFLLKSFLNTHSDEFEKAKNTIIYQ